MAELMDVINAKGKKKPSNKEVLNDWLKKRKADGDDGTKKKAGKDAK
jgi:hypothetical protein